MPGAGWPSRSCATFGGVNDTINSLLIIWVCAGLLGVLVTCLLAFLVIRTAILGALKAHSRWVTNGMP